MTDRTGRPEGVPPAGRARARRALRLVAALVGGALALAGLLARADDPHKRWRTIETDHFHVVFYDLGDGSGEEVAQRVARIAERTHARLLPYLGPGLSERRKTWVVITDDTDDFNGSANVQPYPAVRLFATAPDDRSELSDYDDWLTALFVHEYSHVLHLGTIGGPCATLVNAVLGWGLGTIYAPNQAQPRFLIEGLAVFQESERTSGGRLRNTLWNSFLRAAALEGRLLRIDQFSNLPNRFPYANAAYLYGSALLRHFVARFGHAALLAFSEDYGSVCLPGGVNRSAARVSGKTWVELWREVRGALTADARALAASVARRGLTPARQLTRPADATSRPVFTPDGRALLYIENDGTHRPSLRRLELATGRWRHERFLDGAGGPALGPDGTVYFHAADPFRTFYLFNDLYAWIPGRGAPRRLTHGARAANPAVSPDGRRLAFELNRGSSRGLGILDLETGAIETPIPPGRFEQVFTPTFAPDGKTVAFSWWREGGYRDIWLLDLATGERRPITHDRALDAEPRFSPDGRWLYFVSDRTGVYNLFAFERATGQLHQATNVLNGVLDPALSPDGTQVAFVGLRADGYVLEVAPIDPARFTPAAPPLLDRPDEPPPPAAPALPTRRYNPLPTSIPWVFSPVTRPDGYGQLIGLHLGGADVVGHHRWALELLFGTGRADDVQLSFNYGYSGLWPELHVGAARALTRRAALVAGAEVPFDQDIWSIGTSVSLPIVRRYITSSTLTLSYDVAFPRDVTQVGPASPVESLPDVPSSARAAGVGINWSFSEVRRFRNSVSAEQGREIALGLGLSARLLGASADALTASWRWTEYVPLPWPRPLKNHVLSLAYSGGISAGDPAGRGRFFLGGYPSQDLLRAIYDFARPGSAALRGYPYASVSGDQFHVLNVEYRFPIAWLDRGVETFPLYLRRLHGKAFFDYGGAFAGGFAWDKLKRGIGAELVLEIMYGWYFPAALQLGYGYGFDPGGGSQVYFLINNPF